MTQERENPPWGEDMSASKELHFYPGVKRLLFKQGGKVVFTGEAWGGPRTTIPDPRGMDADPTTPGRYIIYGEEAYFSRTWPLSRIRWGTRLQDKRSDVWYEVNPGTWASLEKDFKITRAYVIARNQEYYGKAEVPDKWIFNDFGPIAIRYFKDLNGNGKFDKGKETLMGEMLHTTPENEGQYKRGRPFIMRESHGCIHLKPPERDTLRKLGAFDPGTPFIVHTYTEKP
jgi:hypothetical protein